MSVPNTNSIRPVEQTPRVLLAGLLNSLRKFVGGDRFENLYKAIDSTIANLDKADLFVLDYGCGAMNFSLRLKQEGRISKFIGMDIFPKPTSSKNVLDIWENYQQIPKEGIRKSSEEFDLAIVIDVLHHAPEQDQAKILRSLVEVSRYVLVKDHFEYGFISRHILRLADWYGNYAYGVSIPKRYFDKKRWSTLIESAGLRELKIKTNVRVHEGLFGLIIPPRHHFISILQKIN
jgi:hypothetical protein